MLSEKGIVNYTITSLQLEKTMKIKKKKKKTGREQTKIITVLGIMSDYFPLSLLLKLSRMVFLL